MLRGIALAWALLAATTASGAALDAPRVEVVHLLANTGMAAGGHAALRVDDHAFHWEVHEDGWLRLGREPWETFWLRYGALENRPMRATRLALPPAAAGAIRDALFALWSRQARDLAELEALALETAWAAQRAGGPPAQLAGAGFFDAASEGSGAGRALRAQLPELAFSEARAALDAELSEGSLRGAALRDALHLRAAWRVLEEARGLDPDAVLDVERFLEDGAPLGPREREQLQMFGSALAETVTRLLASPRPDRGRPLLLAIARHHVVHESLEAGRWLVLDPLAGAPELVDADRARDQRALLAELLGEAASSWHEVRTASVGAPLDEATYNEVENSGAGVLEVSRALREGRGLRVRPLGKMIPAHAGPAEPLPGPGPAALPRAREAEAAFRAELAERYAYDLVTHNCVTEIEAVLGGAAPFEVASVLGFAPFELARAARESELAAATRAIPSARQRRAAALRSDEPDGWTALREASPQTSRAYPGSITDDPFLFFADGSPWLRPPQGAMNFGYALGHAAFGVFSAPLDRGRRLFRGLRSAFYSAPELVGVSIRKGRYDLVPPGLGVSPDPQH